VTAIAVEIAEAQLGWTASPRPRGPSSSHYYATGVASIVIKEKGMPEELWTSNTPPAASLEAGLVGFMRFWRNRDRVYDFDD
jgi:hypothetical protein